MMERPSRTLKVKKVSNNGYSRQFKDGIILRAVHFSTSGFFILHFLFYTTSHFLVQIFVFDLEYAPFIGNKAIQLF
jgi:hypothetical protein